MGRWRCLRVCQLPATSPGNSVSTRQRVYVEILFNLFTTLLPRLIVSKYYSTFLLHDTQSWVCQNLISPFYFTIIKVVSVEILLNFLLDDLSTVWVSKSYLTVYYTIPKVVVVEILLNRLSRRWPKLYVAKYYGTFFLDDYKIVCGNLIETFY